MRAMESLMVVESAIERVKIAERASESATVRGSAIGYVNLPARAIESEMMVLSDSPRPEIFVVMLSEIVRVWKVVLPKAFLPVGEEPMVIVSEGAPANPYVATGPP